MILWFCDCCFKCLLPSSPPHSPATLLVTLPISTDICILFATSPICPLLPLKKKRRQPLHWCLLAEIFDCNQSNPHLFQLRIWPQDFQCLSCNRSRIRPGHYVFGRSPRHFQVLQKAVPAILQFVRIFFSPIRIKQGWSVQWVGHTKISSRHSFDYQTWPDLPQGLVVGWGVQGHGPAHFIIQCLMFLDFFLFSVQKGRETP